MASRTVEVPFARQSNPQEFREQGYERLINAYAETLGEGKDAKVRVRMSPGLTSFGTGPAHFGARGAIKSGDYIYVVYETGVAKFNSAGTRTNLTGGIAGTTAVSMALNAASTPQIGVVASGRYYVIENDVVSQVPTSYLSGFTPTSICWIGGYFILTDEDGRFFNTGLNDAKSINGLDFATAEGSPDGLLGGIALRSELWLFGEETIEVWANEGNSPGSPFGRQGGSWINKGCKSYHSIVQADNTLYWVGNDGIVYRNDAYRPLRASHEGVERSIANATSPSTIRGGTYTIHGHAFYVISDASFTWVYDIKERRWHERKSLGLDRWKAAVFINAFDKWLVGTIDDGNIYEIDMDSRLEGGNSIPWEMHSINMGDTPERAVVSGVEINFVTGRAVHSGTVPQTAPFIELSYTDDGGAIYSMPRQILLGSTGQYDSRCRAWRFGRTGAKWGRRWKITGSDPHILAMWKFIMHVEPLAA